GRGQGPDGLPLRLARPARRADEHGQAPHLVVHQEGARRARAPALTVRATSMRSLRGAVVAITGASAGIGRACALAFAREGASVVLAARRGDQLEAVAAEIRARGGAVAVEVVDVGLRDDVRRMVDTAVARFGRLDVLVNNAGYGVIGRVEDTPVDD